MAATTDAGKGWISVPETARIGGCSIREVRRLIESRMLTTRQVPGAHVKVLRADAERLRERFVVPAEE